MSIQTTDVVIVGAGPIGLEMAVALKRAGIEYLQFDARQVGYTVSWFAPQTRFFSSNERIAIAGVPLETPDQSKATREQYLTYLRGVVRLFDLKIRSYEPVVGIEKAGDEFLLTTEPAGMGAAGRKQVRAKKVILATGGTDRPRRLGIPGEELPHVEHYFKDPHSYFGRRVLIVGGKNSAVEAALRCHHAGAQVVLSYRRAELNSRSIKYWLTPEISSLIKEGRIEGHFGTVPTRISPGEVELASVSSGERLSQRTRVSADFVLVLIGFLADVTLLRISGVQLIGESQSPQFDPQTMQTNVPGIFVAGTATGGTQERYTLFIENCHVHVQRIVAALTGATPPATPMPNERPES